MIIVYTKEKRPVEVFNVNLTKQEVEENNIDIWVDHPNLNKDNYIVVYNQNFDYPILENNEIREMTRNEKVENDIEVHLEEGEIIKDKKIIEVPLPKDLYRPLWNGKEWEEGANKETLMDELANVIIEYREKREKIDKLEEEGRLDPILAVPKTVEKLKNELKEVRKKIIELKNIINSL